MLESSSWRLTRPLRRLRGSKRPEALPPPVVVADALTDSPLPAAASESLEAAVPVQFPPGHYYAPLVDPAEIAVEPRHSQIWPTVPRATPGVDWRDDEQVALFRDVFSHQQRLVFRDDASDAPGEYHALNGQYPPLDAWLLEAVLRWLRPQRMIEIGSGFSSLVTARVNREYFDFGMRFTCMEPYPRPVPDRRRPRLVRSDGSENIGCFLGCVHDAWSR
jgi:hypothetical protein